MATPTSHDTSDMGRDLEESLQGALRRSFDKSKVEPKPALPPADQLRAPDPLPRQIAGGFDGLFSDLDRRSRDSGTTVRLLHQQRTHLATAEAERDGLYDKLPGVLSEVMESGRSLAQMMENAKAGNLSGDLSSEFARNLRALDELESISEALSANLLWTRSGWEQYARSIMSAQRMRDGSVA